MTFHIESKKIREILLGRIQILVIFKVSDPDTVYLNGRILIVLFLEGWIRTRVNSTRIRTGFI